MESDIHENSIRSINQAAFVNLETLIVVLEMALCLAVNCDNTEQIIGSFTEKLDEQTLDDLMQITQDVLVKYGKRDEESINNTMSENPNQQSSEMAMMAGSGGMALGSQVAGQNMTMMNNPNS